MAHNPDQLEVDRRHSERAKRGEKYYYLAVVRYMPTDHISDRCKVADSYVIVVEGVDNYSDENNRRFRSGNYSLDEGVMKRRLEYLKVLLGSTGLLVGGMDHILVDGEKGVENIASTIRHVRNISIGGDGEAEFVAELTEAELRLLEKIKQRLADYDSGYDPDIALRIGELGEEQRLAAWCEDELHKWRAISERVEL